MLWQVVKLTKQHTQKNRSAHLSVFMDKICKIAVIMLVQPQIRITFLIYQQIINLILTILTQKMFLKRNI